MFHIKPGTLERFTLIEKMEKEEFPIQELCKTLAMSRSGYYAHINEEECQRQRADADLLPKQ